MTAGGPWVTADRLEGGRPLAEGWPMVAAWGPMVAEEPGSSDRRPPRRRPGARLE